MQEKKSKNKAERDFFFIYGDNVNKIKFTWIDH